MRDIHGQIIKSQDMDAAYYTLTVNTSALALTSGVYILTLTDGITQQAETLKIIIQ